MRRSGLPYLALLSLVAIQVIYAGYWAVHDISARMGLWADTDAARTFVSSLTVTQEVLFFSHVILNAVVLGLVWKQRWWALPAFILSFVLDRAEWVMMTGNVVFSNMVAVDSWTLFSFTLQGMIIALLVILVFEGRLR